MFGGFKATLNFFGKKNQKGLHSELSPDMTVSGAYRTSRDDSFGYNNSFDQSKNSTASEQFLQQIRPTKSSNDLPNVQNVPSNLRHSATEVSRDPRGAPQDDQRNGSQNLKLTKNQEKEQKKLEKLRLAEQKAREKQTREEQAKQERLKRVQEMKVAQEKVKRPEKKKKAAPQPQATTPVPQTSTQNYSTNTLESSISRSSGPPPYSDVPVMKPEKSNVKNKNDRSSNVTYSKPVDTGSWDLISEHRQQTIRPTATVGSGMNKSKQMIMDLNYNFSTPREVTENSDA